MIKLDIVSGPVVDIGFAGCLNNRVEVRNVNDQKLFGFEEAKNEFLLHIAFVVFKRFVLGAGNRQGEGIIVKSAALKKRLGKTSTRFMCTVPFGCGSCQRERWRYSSSGRISEMFAV